MAAVDSSSQVALAGLALAGLAVIVAAVMGIYGRRQTLAAEASIPAPSPPVDWVVLRSDEMLLLRNVGTDTATGVRIDGSQHYSVQLWDKTGIVRSKGSIPFQVYVVWSSGHQCNEVPVIWDGQDKPVLVPIPPH